jgi:adenylate cyclase class IV
VRDEGDKVTMAYKARLGVKKSDGTENDEGMEEIEVEVNSFEKITKIFQKIGLKEKFYEENRRIRYVKNDVEFDIDFWPGIKPYLEIEADSWEKVEDSIKELGLDPDKKKIFSTWQIYHLNGINEGDYKIITFEKMVKK